MNNTQRRTVSTSFAVFLNTFLIISTVIVFAVLLFLSYENMIDGAIADKVASTRKTACDVAEDYSVFFAASPDGKGEIYNAYLHSDLLSDNGKIYIVDGQGIIYFSNQNWNDSSMHAVDSEFVDLIADCQALDDKSLYEISDNKIWCMSCIPIDGTDMFSLVIDTYDIALVKSEFVSVILIPGLIAMLFAVALFIGFVGLTVKPIREISKTISKVSTGDFTARIDPKYINPGGSSLIVSSDLSDMGKTVNYMIESLDNQEKDRNVFISSVAHDIRTPLTSINGFITAMLDGTIPYENQEKYLILIKQEVDRIRKLIVSMTEASSLSHVDPELMEEFDIKDVIEDIVDNLEPQLKEKRISLTTDIDTSDGTLVYGEAAQLCRVIVNIVSNAIKFTPENGTIIVSSWPEKNNKMGISVEDSGPGVEKEKRARVFESFYKADPSRKQEGFGLGLYICKMILQGHGQSIVLDESSTLGGAKFVFSFPRPGRKDD